MHTRQHNPLPSSRRAGHSTATLVGVLLLLTAGYTSPALSAADPGQPPDRQNAVDHQAELPASPDAPADGYFTPPPHGAYPEGEFGAAVKRGEAYFRDTRGTAGQYVGNQQDCANCHIDWGRQPNASPMWAAWVSYPAYRKKNDKVNTMEERIQGCFTYSMNAPASKVGHAPESNDPVLTDLQSYMYWLATGAPTGENLPGRGYPKLTDPPEPYSPQRGGQVYQQHCALCHGDDGAGNRRADGAYQFPPLWGAGAYNWGAGMHRVNTAAGFIKANMPLGKPDSLTLQQAWDVAAFINQHERPDDPRDKGDLAATDEQFHQHQCYYGEQTANTP